jgi:DNA-binding transcriptional LysR family regulator
MDIHQLKVFISVFKNRSFSRASEELFLTQPTISDHIKTLEEEFACRLFDRLGRTILPTKEAETLYSHAVELIEKAAAIKDAVGHLKREPAGELIIGASTIPGTYIMPSITASFRKKYPAVSFQIIISDSGGITEKVLAHELLLGITGTKPKNEHIHCTPVMEDELIVVSSPSLIHDNRMKLKEMITFPMILREKGSGTLHEIERIMEGRGVLENVNIAGVFGSTDAVKQAVKAGLGISILSRLSVADELKHNILKEIKIADLSMTRKFYIVTHRKRTLPHLYTVFMEHLKSAAKIF